ncbi:MAG: hypothetical protein EOM37_13540 [Proteobacteria bacterium]|nr:hypothetical protein [Pseudomonadota bacterium]
MVRIRRAQMVNFRLSLLTGGAALPDASFGVVDLLQFLPRARWFVWREVVFSVLMTRGGEFCRCAETAT